MELVKELSYKKGNWRRDAGITATALGLVVVCIGIWLREFMVAEWYHVLIASALAYLLHELVHGTFFKLWAGKVEFGAGITRFGPVFYATSPGALLSRNRVLIVALAPQILTILFLSLRYLPLIEPVQVVLVLAGAVNLAGGASDFYCVTQVARYPRRLRVEDQPMGMKFYLPAKEVIDESAKHVA